MRAHGATVIEVGRDFDEAKQEAKRAAAERNLHFVPSFHRDLVVGVATYALEFLRTVAHLDTIYVSVGMGSAICGLITAPYTLVPNTEIVGVAAINAPATASSFAAGPSHATDTTPTC